MQDVTISTRGGPLAKVQESNSTVAGTAVANPADTFVNPRGTAGYIDLANDGQAAPNALWLKPFSVGNDDTTYLMAVFAVTRIINRSATLLPDQWTHTLLAAFTCTASTHVGIAGGIVVATERYADTIVLITNAGNANVSHEAVSPATNLGGHVVVDCKGAELAYVSFFMNNSATSANALYRKV